MTRDATAKVCPAWGCFTKLNAHPQGHYIGIEKFIYWVFNGNFFGSQILQWGFYNTMPCYPA
jgi:hypothetical protein